MATNPFYVHPGADLGLGLQRIGTQIENRAQVELARVEKQKQQEQLNIAGNMMRSGDMQGLSEIILKNPAIGEQVTASMNFKNTATKKNASDTSFRILSGENPQQVLTERVDFLTRSGGDPSGTLKLLQSGTPDEINKMAELTLMSADPKLYKTWKESTAPGGIGGEANVKSSDILEDGTVVQSTTTGVRVFGPEGNLLKGKDAASAIKRARAEKVSNLRKAAGGKKTASLEAELVLYGVVAANVIGSEDAAKISVKAFDRLEKINKNIANIDEGIRLLNEGANTGAIDRYLPSVKATSIKLDNLAGRLGLDVISAVTFGALSESELKFAVDTALPRGLQPEQLKQWLIDKKASQEKLADYLEASAIYLGTPGNTVSGWIEKGRQKTNALPEGLAEDTITFNMEKYGKTREQVIEKFSGGK